MKEDWYMDECLAFFLLGRLEAMGDALSKRPVEDIELQLIMWLKPFIDWHKQWVKAGRPLNLD